MTMETWAMGIDIGAVAIKLAVLKDGCLQATEFRLHHGDLLGCLQAMVARWRGERMKVLLTGSGAKGFPSPLVVDEIVAALEGTKWLTRKKLRSLLIIGGEKIRFVELDAAGRYRRHETNSDCASGTGSFLEQQAARLGLDLESFERLAYEYEGEVPAIATRCAVFARTDLIHRQQEGYSLASIAAGISEGVSRAVVDAVIRGRKVEPPLLVVGGGSLHRRLLAGLSQVVGFQVEPVPSGELAAAVGAALLASQEIWVENLFSSRPWEVRTALPLNPPLTLQKSSLPDLKGVESCEEAGVEVNLFRPINGRSQCKAFLGLDVGSTSTKLVLIDEEGKIILGLYTRTASAPVAATQRLFSCLERLSQEWSVDWVWPGVATTGSGRALLGQLIKADLIINEITAQARAAAFFLPEVDTVIEIGGQDSKFIRLQEGAVVQSLLNTICAAGTGSFLEEQALKLGLPLSAYTDLALGHRGPAISDRCTVYMERDLTRLQAEGWPKEELLASALHSVRDNYLIRVVGQAKVGQKICFQGATARNAGLVAAFETALGRPVIVPPYPHLTGAFGAALLVRELNLNETKFSGLSFGRAALEQRIETCDLCPNSCRLTVVKVGEALAAWGFQCGREYEERRKRLSAKPKITKHPELARKSTARLGLGPSSAAKRKTIGLPFILPLAETETLWTRFFEELGFNVVLSTSKEEQLSQGKTLAQAEFCAPIYLAHGQVEELFRLGCEAVFMPLFVQGPELSPNSRLPNFYCYYTNYFPVILRHSPVGEKGPIIAPVIDFRWPAKRLMASLEAHLKKLSPFSRSEIKTAWKKAWSDWQQEKQHRQEEGERLLRELKSGQWAVVLLGRPYNLYQPVLNQNLPEVIAEYGLPVLTQDMLATSANKGEKNESLIHWHYGKIIMEAAEQVAADDRLFPVFLTNFRCSPDSFILNYFRDLMERAHKPYLILQLDGLNSDIGYRTRLEAAIESFRHWKPTSRQAAPRISFSTLKKDRLWIVPHVDDTASVLAVAALNRFGYEALLAKEDSRSIQAGLGLTGGGECLPTAAFVGSIIQTMNQEKIPPFRAAVVVPTSLFSCNFPQIPVLVKLLLERIGLGEVAIFTTGLAGQHEPFELSLTLFHAYALADGLRRLVAKVRPYEKNKGETEAYRQRALALLAHAIHNRGSLGEAFGRVIKEFAAIPVGEGRARPLIAIIGDLYVIANPEFNLQVEKEVEAAGGEVIPASLIDITHFSQLNRIEKAWNYRRWPELIKTSLLQLLLRLQEKKWRHLSATFTGIKHEPLSLFSVRQLRAKAIPPELDGETAINLAKIEHYLQEIKPDAFLHVNPLYCCPGVVTASLTRWLEDKYRVPVINLYYDGLHNPNDNLRPYLHFLCEAKERKRLDSALQRELQELRR